MTQPGRRRHRRSRPALPRPPGPAVRRGQLRRGIPPVRAAGAAHDPDLGPARLRHQPAGAVHHHDRLLLPVRAAGCLRLAARPARSAERNPGVPGRGHRSRRRADRLARRLGAALPPVRLPGAAPARRRRRPAAHHHDRGGSFLFPALGPHLVGLTPSQTASFDLAYTDVPAGSLPYRQACPAAATLVIIPPGDVTSLRATARIAPCHGDLDVSPVVPGTIPIPFS
jgi:hypothetical protein